ncbi:hypothetical protein OHQ89_47450 [Streptomyces canus]|uniref:hypothetical protein n=1 Tax=Streptomyces canus TaxID=58343 RepID=UPI0030E40FFB
MSETTSRTRRRALPAPDVLNTRFVEGAGVVQPEPAPPNPPQPFGDLAAASVEELFEAADMVGDGDASSVRSKRRQSVSAITQYLSAFPGGTWQERWTASELDDAEDPIPFSQVRRRWVETGSIVQGVTLMTTFRAIHPSLRALRANMLPNFAEVFLTGQGTADIDAALRAIESSPYSGLSRRRARHDLAAALVTQKIAMSDLTPSALLHYAWEWRRICTTIGNGEVSFGARVLWEILCETGHFPPTTPNTLRRALNGNPHDLAALISRYELRNKAVERLLVDYMRIRVADGLDFSSASALARTLARNFWQTIESVNPDQNDLRLSPETYRAWLERISVKADGQPRIDTDNIQLAVRAFYLDLSAWATAEPERWGMWAAPFRFGPAPPAATPSGSAAGRKVSPTASASCSRCCPVWCSTSTMNWLPPVGYWPPLRRHSPASSSPARKSPTAGCGPSTTATGPAGTAPHRCAHSACPTRRSPTPNSPRTPHSGPGPSSIPCG